MKQTENRQSEDQPQLVQTFPSVDLDDVFQNVFRTAVVCRGLRHVRHANWQSERAFAAATAGDYVRPDDEVLTQMRDECDLRLALRRGAVMIQLFACVKLRRVSLSVAAADAGSADAAMLEHQARFETAAQAPRGATFGFWFLGEQGPEREKKRLSLPQWRDIRNNYASPTAHQIDALIASFKPGAGGRLLLWHGPPGTGKTFAIRALAWEWREWCQFEYVFDPENLFGSRADYLARIVMDGGEQEDPQTQGRWRMLVLEDTGELLSIDARERAGQGLSRLLNAVDGLLGQGSRVMLLITTNEQWGALHPAVTRPGRCAAQIEFRALDAAQSRNWLDAHGRRTGAAPRSPKTIAELYALLEGRIAPERTRIGFTRTE